MRIPPGYHVPDRPGPGPGTPSRRTLLTAGGGLALAAALAACG